MFPATEVCSKSSFLLRVMYSCFADDRNQMWMLEPDWFDFNFSWIEWE